MGSNFNPAKDVEVLFGKTYMPVQSVSSAGTSIVVAFPTGGLPNTGALDVTVRNLQTGSAKATEDTLLDGFYYVNPPSRACFIATAAFGTPLESRLGVFRDFRDGVLLKSAAGTALVDFYYRVSPGIADRVAQNASLAAVLRTVLMIAAWALTWPLATLAIMGVGGFAAVKARRIRARRNG